MNDPLDFLKMLALALRDMYALTAFIQTGAAEGALTAWAAEDKRFDAVFAGERNRALYEQAQKACAPYQHARVLHGEPVVRLPKYLADCEGRALILFDAPLETGTLLAEIGQVEDARHVCVAVGEFTPNGRPTYGAVVQALAARRRCVVRLGGVLVAAPDAEAQPLFDFAAGVRSGAIQPKNLEEPKPAPKRSRRSTGRKKTAARKNAAESS